MAVLLKSSRHRCPMKGDRIWGEASNDRQTEHWQSLCKARNRWMVSTEQVTEPPLLHCKAAQAATRMKNGKVQRQDDAPIQLPEQQHWQSCFLYSWNCKKLEGSQVPGKDQCTFQDLRKSTERNIQLQINLTDTAWKQGRYSGKDSKIKKTTQNINVNWYDIHLDKAQGTNLKSMISHVQIFQ